MKNTLNKNSEIVRVAAYLRTSTDRQEKEGTIKSQFDQVKNYVKEHYPYIKETDIIVYKDDGWPSATLERPDMDKLRISLPDDLWDVLIMPDPDRIAREPYLQLLILEEVEKSGKRLEFCEVDSPDSENEDSLMMFEFRAMMAKYEKVRINSRFRVGKLRRANSKQIMVSVPPYGYKLVKRHDNPKTGQKVETKLVVDKTEAEAIKQIFSWYVRDKLSMRTITQKLKQLGIQPRKNKNGDWNTTTIRNILTNETYIGRGFYRRTKAVEPTKPIRKLEKEYRKNSKTSRTARPEEEWIEIPVTPILKTTEEQKMFLTAQKQREKNAHLNSRNRKNEYLLGGKMYCTCGAARTGEGPQNGKYLYYRCGGRHNNQTTARSKCDLKGINARISDEMVWNNVERVITDDAFLATQISLYYQTKSENGYLVSKAEMLDKQINKLTDRLASLKQSVLDEDLSVEEYRELKSVADKQITELGAELAEIKDKLVNRDSELITEKEFETMVEKTKIKLKNLNFKAKRAIVEQLVDEVVGEPGHLTVTGHINLSASSETQSPTAGNYSSNLLSNHVKYKSSGRDSWVAKCWEINAFYCPHQK